MPNIEKYSKEEVENLNWWKEKCGEIKKGIYIYRLAENKIPYPLKESDIFYIGKAVNIPKRLHWHFTVDCRERLINSEETLAWFYQNYYKERISHNIQIIEFNESEKELYHLECLFIGIFALKFGSMPLCNGMVGRKRFKEIYENPKHEGEIRAIKKILAL